MSRRASFLARLFKKTLGVELREVFEAGMQAQRDCCLFALRGHLDDVAMARFIQAMDWEARRQMTQADLLSTRERRLRLFEQYDG